MKIWPSNRSRKTGNLGAYGYSWLGVGSGLSVVATVLFILSTSKKHVANFAGVHFRELEEFDEEALVSLDREQKEIGLGSRI